MLVKLKALQIELNGIYAAATDEYQTQSIQQSIVEQIETLEELNIGVK